MVAMRICLFVALASAWAPSAFAAQLFSEVFIGAGSFDGVDVINFTTSATGAPVSLGASETFEFDDGDSFETTTFNGQGSASAQFGRLRAAASGSVSNIQNPVEPYEPGGYPEVFLVDSIAQSTETLQYGGSATSYTSRYIFRVTGNISGEDAFAVLRVKQADDFEELFTFFDSGVVNEMVATDAFVHGGSPQEIQVTLNTQYQPLSEFFSPGDGSSGAAAFGSTVELIGIDVRDQNGMLLPQGAITSSSGMVIPIVDASTIPEPTSVLLAFVAAGMSLASPRSLL